MKKIDLKIKIEDALGREIVQDGVLITLGHVLFDALIKWQDLAWSAKKKYEVGKLMESLRFHPEKKYSENEIQYLREAVGQTQPCFIVSLVFDYLDEKDRFVGLNDETRAIEAYFVRDPRLREDDIEKNNFKEESSSSLSCME